MIALKLIGLFFVFCVVSVAWVLDVLSTWIGLSFFGLHEANTIFLQVPYLWLVAVLSVSSLIYFFKWAPLWIRQTLLAVIMLGCFSPALGNVYVIFKEIL